MPPSPRQPRLLRPGATGRRLRVACWLVAWAFVGGCASLDDAAFFPLDYQTQYTKVHNCKKSAHPTGDHVVVWVNDIGREAFEAGTTPLPEGTVLLKSQYSDAACTRLVRYTAMQKGAAGSAPDRGDWQWQFLRDDGSLADCCDGGDVTAKTTCAGCHKACSGNDWICTRP